MAGRGRHGAAVAIAAVDPVVPSEGQPGGLDLPGSLEAVEALAKLGDAILFPHLSDFQVVSYTDCVESVEQLGTLRVVQT